MSAQQKQKSNKSKALFKKPQHFPSNEPQFKEEHSNQQKGQQNPEDIPLDTTKVKQVEGSLFFKQTETQKQGGQKQEDIHEKLKDKSIGKEEFKDEKPGKSRSQKKREQKAKKLSKQREQELHQEEKQKHQQQESKDMALTSEKLLKGTENEPILQKEEEEIYSKQSQKNQIQESLKEAIEQQIKKEQNKESKERPLERQQLLTSKEIDQALTESNQNKESNDSKKEEQKQEQEYIRQINQKLDKQEQRDQENLELLQRNMNIGVSIEDQEAQKERKDSLSKQEAEKELEQLESNIPTFEYAYDTSAQLSDVPTHLHPSPPPEKSQFFKEESDQQENEVESQFSKVKLAEQQKIQDEQDKYREELTQKLEKQRDLDQKEYSSQKQIDQEQQVWQDSMKLKNPEEEGKNVLNENRKQFSEQQYRNLQVEPELFLDSQMQLQINRQLNLLQSQKKNIMNYCNTMIKEGQKLMKLICLALLYKIHQMQYRMYLENKRDDFQHEEIIRILEKQQQDDMIHDIINREYNKFSKTIQTGQNIDQSQRTEDPSCYNEKGQYDPELCNLDIQRRDWEGQDNMKQFSGGKKFQSK
ncbi:UNKNOWN [Stylonychia lemnae]|uniref:Uncharacterized protein n=1 Tax=Stylonychia lemnae TaxID=5949 RepID=A0A078A2P4_STYLE|nr:UNKNOWN [Stylonychia lemnae]|eukprot:CDW76519.1 UNKNOWN [Stylonychia lemnae]